MLPNLLKKIGYACYFVAHGIEHVIDRLTGYHRLSGYETEDGKEGWTK